MPDTVLALTTKGQALKAKIEAGGGTLALEITRIVAASGTSLAPTALTDVLDYEQDFDILEANTEGNKTIIKAALTNAGNPAKDIPPLAVGYDLYQIGMYAADPDDGEILYRITQRLKPIVVPPASDRGWTYSPSFTIVHDNASEIIVHIDPLGLASFKAIGEAVEAAVEAAKEELSEGQSIWCTVDGAFDTFELTTGRDYTLLTDGQRFEFYTERSSNTPTIWVDAAPDAHLMKATAGVPTEYGKIKPGVVSIAYVADKNCFFMCSGVGEYGTAEAAQVLAPYTYGTEDGVKAGTMPNRGAVNQSLTTNGASYTVPDGYHNGAGKVTANITNLTAANVRSGQTVGGVAGTFSSTTSAPTAGEILANKIAFANGAQLTGTMVDRGSPTFTPGASAQSIPAGRYTGGVVAAISAGGGLMMKVVDCMLADVPIGSSLGSATNVGPINLGVTAPKYIYIYGSFAIGSQGSPNADYGYGYNNSLLFAIDWASVPIPNLNGVLSSVARVEIAAYGYVNVYNNNYLAGAIARLYLNSVTFSGTNLTLNMYLTSSAPSSNFRVSIPKIVVFY